MNWIPSNLFTNKMKLTESNLFTTCAREMCGLQLEWTGQKVQDYNAKINILVSNSFTNKKILTTSNLFTERQMVRERKVRESPLGARGVGGGGWGGVL